MTTTTTTERGTSPTDAGHVKNEDGTWVIKHNDYREELVGDNRSRYRLEGDRFTEIAELVRQATTSHWNESEVIVYLDKTKWEKLPLALR